MSSSQSSSQQVRRGPFLVAAVLAGLLALGLGAGLSNDLAMRLFVRLGVPWAAFSLLALVACALLLVWQRWQELPVAGRRALGRDAGAALLIVLLVVLLVPARSLVENDESTLQLTADAIRFTGSPVVSASGFIDSAGILHPILVYLEKRGLMFPLTLVPLHAAGLPGIQAAWTLNAAALWLALLAVARITRRYRSGPAPLLAMLLLAAFPLVLVTARIGTYDMVNFALLAALLHLGLSTARQPSLPRLCGCAALAAVLTQLRYEAVLPAALLAAVLLVRALWHGPPQRGGMLLASLPLWIAPGLWRMAVATDLELPNAQARAWSFGNALDNGTALLRWSFGPAGWESGQPLVGGLALLGLLAWLARRGWRGRGLDLLLLGAPLLLLLALLLPSFWGEVTYNLTTRYYLFYCALLALAATAAIVALRRLPDVIALALGVALFGLGLQQARVARQFEFPDADYRDGIVDAVARAYGECSVVVAAQRPVVVLRNQISAIHFQAWQQLQGQIEPYLESIGVVAVAAPLAARLGVPYYADTHRQDVLDDPLVASSQHGHVSVELRELWRSPRGLQDCPRRQPVRAIDAGDHAAAQRLPGAQY